MMNLNSIAARLERRFGPSVHPWVDNLPERIADLAAQWRLEIGTAFERGHSSVAFRCTGERGTTVLKLCPDRKLAAEEVRMLRLFASSGRVPGVLEHADDAILMEAIEPGTPVEKLPCPSATEYAEFLHALHSVSNVESAPRSLYGWTEVLFTAAARRGAVIDDARQLRDRLIATETQKVLLHGDLHLGNVLDGGARGLVAIDPTACAGDPCFDAIDYVLEATSRAEITQRRDDLAKAADLDADRLDAWCRVTAPIGATFVPPHHAAELLAFARSAP